MMAFMAKTTHTVITDDIDGSADAETYSFAFNGVEYSIDLGEKNSAKLEKALAPFIDNATKVGGRRRSSGARSNGASRNDLADVRAWAKKQKLEVSERGRISKSVLEAYDAAH